MRIRSIKPDFFKDEELAELPPLARLLFIGLWCLADCAGRIKVGSKSGSKRIKVEVLPYDDAPIDPLLIQLHEKGFIIMYEVNEDHYIQVIQFLRHQRITGKEAESQSCLPEYDPVQHGKQRGNTGEATGKHPDSLEGKGREGKGKGTVSVVSPSEIKNSFDRFWTECPRKVAKEDAWKAFKARGCHEHIEMIVSAMKRHRDSDDWKKEGGRFIPHPATWLNGKRWEDIGFAPSAQTAPIPMPVVPDVNLAAEFQAKLDRQRAEQTGEA